MVEEVIMVVELELGELRMDRRLPDQRRLAPVELRTDQLLPEVGALRTGWRLPGRERREPCRRRGDSSGVVER